MVKLAAMQHLTFIKIDGSLSRISVDKTPLGSGAEGAIYQINSHPDLVAKLYHHPGSDPARLDKIKAMLQSPPQLSAIESHGQKYIQLAWPVGWIVDGGGQFAGYIMPKVNLSDSAALEALMSAKTRRAYKINEAYGYRITAAYNLAAIVSALHANGHHIIDLKPININFYKKAFYIAILDCDGFSIQGEKTRFTAQQYSDGYICPEALNSKLHPGQLGEDQDRFALAVVLFQLMNQGLHPFQGIPAKAVNLPTTNSERVQQGLYAYGLKQNALLKPSPWSIHDYFDDDTRTLFDRAFLSQYDRPTANEWRNHLISYADKASGKLKICTVNPIHGYFSRGCGFCALTKVKIKQPPPHTATQPSQQRVRYQHGTPAGNTTYINRTQTRRFAYQTVTTIQTANSVRLPNPYKFLSLVLAVTLIIFIVFSCNENIKRNSKQISSPEPAFSSDLPKLYPVENAYNIDPNFLMISLGYEGKLPSRVKLNILAANFGVTEDGNNNNDNNHEPQLSVSLTDGWTSIATQLHIANDSVIVVPKTTLLGATRYRVSINDSKNLLQLSPERAENWVFSTKPTDYQYSITELTDHTTDNDHADTIFGYIQKLSKDGHYLVIGEPKVPAKDGDNSGRVYIYTTKNLVGTEPQLIKPPSSPDQVTEFGRAIAVSENGYQIAISAINPTTNSGLVYLYKRQGNNWILDSTFHQPNHSDIPATGNNLAISADGKHLAFLSKLISDNTGNHIELSTVDFLDGTKKRVSLYDIKTGLITDESTVSPSLAMSGNGKWLAVGVPSDSKIKDGEGMVYLLKYGDNHSWTEMPPLRYSIENNYSQFGADVAFSKDASILLVSNTTGYYSIGVSRVKTGTVNVYKNLNGKFIFSQTLYPYDNDVEMQFGGNIDISSNGERIVVGTSYSNSTGNHISFAGNSIIIGSGDNHKPDNRNTPSRAYTYIYDGNNYKALGEINSSIPTLNDDVYDTSVSTGADNLVSVGISGSQFLNQYQPLHLYRERIERIKSRND